MPYFKVSFSFLQTAKFLLNLHLLLNIISLPLTFLMNGLESPGITVFELSRRNDFINGTFSLVNKLQTPIHS